MQTKSFACSGVFLRVESAAACVLIWRAWCADLGSHWLRTWDIPLACTIFMQVAKFMAMQSSSQNTSWWCKWIRLIWKHLFPTSGRQWGQITEPWNTDFRRSHACAFRLRFLSFRYGKCLENRHFQNIKDCLKQLCFLLSVWLYPNISPLSISAHWYFTWSNLKDWVWAIVQATWTVRFSAYIRDNLSVPHFPHFIYHKWNLKY